jgi:hypothetical protein
MVLKTSFAKEAMVAQTQTGQSNTWQTRGDFYQRTIYELNGFLEDKDENYESIKYLSFY